jgi:NitT/TauT family transport system substrate-binding protein
MIMKDQQLVEKQAKAQGFELEAEYRIVSGPAVVNDGMLSGQIHFGGVGVPSLITLWAKTKGSLDYKTCGSLAYQANYLNTNNPDVQSVKDFTDKDKIAVPSVKVSLQAVILQMAAAQAFGDAEATRLDRLTVGMSHPDAFGALVSGHSEVNSHLTSPPFQRREIAESNGRVHKVFSSYDILGGEASSSVVIASENVRKENPKAYAAYMAAFKEAIEFANKDKRAAAELYLRVSGSKEKLEEIVEELSNGDTVYGLAPKQTQRYADFMFKIGTIKVKPSSWKDMAQPELHGLPGS